MNCLISIFLNISLLMLFSFNIAAEETGSNYKEYTNTNCEEFVKTDSIYALTYEEKMAIASKKFNTGVNQDEEACNPQSNKNHVGSSGESSSAGNISGTQNTESSNNVKSSSNVGDNSIIEKNNKSSSVTNDNLENGSIPNCISGFKDDDELAAAIKKAISIETDVERKKELIKNYANYKGINIKEDQC